FWCRLIHLKIILWNKPLEIGLCNKAHEVVKIDRDADCSNRYMDCKLSEIVGVSLSEPFLRKNKNGFELKLKGQQDRIIKVPSDMVVSFLDGLDAAKKKY
ncbi:hypothetical protein ABTH30_19840, partial [Acinetobacter baumannii]